MNRLAKFSFKHGIITLDTQYPVHSSIFDLNKNYRSFLYENTGLASFFQSAASDPQVFNVPDTQFFFTVRTYLFSNVSNFSLDVFPQCLHIPAGKTINRTIQYRCVVFTNCSLKYQFAPSVFCTTPSTVLQPDFQNTVCLLSTIDPLHIST